MLSPFQRSERSGCLFAIFRGLFAPFLGVLARPWFFGVRLGGNSLPRQRLRSVSGGDRHQDTFKSSETGGFGGFSGIFAFSDMGSGGANTLGP
jgi:hypothetical protein